ncbi:MAG: sulfur carrier protein ThiS [Rhodanobacteraceae bacterium]
MRIFLNGEPRECALAATVTTLLAETGNGDRRVAVEVNREIVPRSQHAKHELHESDRVEIVSAIGGG